jgi:CheY-like chemotaxis protein
MDGSRSGSDQQPQWTVLVAEDCDSDVMLLREAFRTRAAPVRIERAVDGVAAIERLEREDAWPDLLVLDLRLPRLDGRGVLARLADLPRRLPVVVLTGSATRHARADCLRLGAAHVAVKPSYFGEWLRLVDLVCAHLRRGVGANLDSPTPLGSPTLV